MANWDQYAKFLASIRQEWDRAEADIKRAEQVCNNIVFPSIKELRYAGRRLIEILYKIEASAPDAEIIAHFNDALFDCYRSRHDAIDAATSKMAMDVASMVENIGYDVILHVSPRFPEFYRSLNSVRQKIVASREKREDRDAIYRSIEDSDFPALVEVFSLIQSSEHMMKHVAKGRRKERAINFGIGIVGAILAVIGIILTVAH